MRVQVGGYLGYFFRETLTFWHWSWMCLGRQCRVEVSRNNSRRQADPQHRPLRTFQLFYTLLCPFACEVMVMAIMIMRFMWNRKKVAITGVKRTIAIQLPCTFIHPASSWPTVPCYNSRTFANWNSSQVVVLPYRKPITPPFPSFTTTLFLLFLLVVILKKFFSGGSSLWQVKVPPSLKDLWTPTN